MVTTTYRVLKSLLNMRMELLPEYGDLHILCYTFATSFLEKVKDCRERAKNGWRGEFSTARGASIGWAQANRPTWTEEDYQDGVFQDMRPRSRPNRRVIQLEGHPTGGSSIPAVVQVINDCLRTGCFREDLKHAVVKPCIEETTSRQEIALCGIIVPVSSLADKVVEKVVVRRLVDHLHSHGLEELQSAYKAGHSYSTKAALPKVHDDVSRALGSGMGTLMHAL